MAGRWSDKGTAVCADSDEKQNGVEVVPLHPDMYIMWTVQSSDAIEKMTALVAAVLRWWFGQALIAHDCPIFSLLALYRTSVIKDIV
jgi:hypothetical protein